MQPDNPDPRKRERWLLGCAIFAAPLFAIAGGFAGQLLPPPRHHDFQLLPPLSMPLALIGTFFLALPWAKKQTPLLRVAIGKAIGLAILVCFGWLLLGLAFLFAMCAYREFSR
jgi:hypothetical protein